MKKMFYKAFEQLESGSDVALVTLINSTGSTPRGKGAQMLVMRDETTLGTIGGGLVEHLATVDAAEAIKNKSSLAKKYNLNSKQAADDGMICGGSIEVLINYFSAQNSNDVNLFQKIVSYLDSDTKSWIIFKISDNDIDVGIYSEREPLVIKQFIDDVGDVKTFLRKKPLLSNNIFVLPLVVNNNVYIFGGGHVSQELVPVLNHIGFFVTVVENREEFANPSLFKGVKNVVIADFDKVNNYVSITHDDYVIVVTRGHKSDRAVLSQVLPLNPSYVGVIGSRKKVKITNDALIEMGIDKALTEKIYAPIGVPIKSETPAEIAISIAAQLILHRAENS